VHKFVYIHVSEHFSFAKKIHPPDRCGDRCGISINWFNIVLGTMKGQSKLCSFVAQHNTMPKMSQVLREHAIGMLTAGMSTRAVARDLNVNFSTISHLQHCLAVRPTGLTTPDSPGQPHPASSTAGSSETSHPDSWWNYVFAKPKNFCTNCQKLSQGSSSVCSSSKPGSLPDFRSAS
jgi:hypothetical protein